MAVLGYSVHAQRILEEHEKEKAGQERRCEGGRKGGGKDQWAEKENKSATSPGPEHSR